MEPLSVLGVAGNVIQMVDISARLLSNIKQLASSATGEIEKNRQIRETTTKLLSLNSRLIGSLNQKQLNREPTDLETELVDLSENCNIAARELTEVLDGVSSEAGKRRKLEDGHSGLSVESIPPHSDACDRMPGKWDSIKGGIKAMWKEKDVERLLQRLMDARQLLATSILVNLQYDSSTLLSTRNLLIDAQAGSFGF